MELSDELFAQACAQLQGREQAQAEAVLVRFRKSEQAIEIAQRILVGSPEPFVRFQAAAVLRHAAVEQWSAMHIQGRAALRRQLLALVVERCDKMTRPEWMKVLETIGVLWKRGWLDADDPGLEAGKEELFKQIGSLVKVESGFALHQVVGLQLLSTLIEEFSSNRSSAIGVSLAFHRRCHESFERAGLRESFVLACSMLDQIATRTDALGSAGRQGAELLRSCLVVLEACLSWDFCCGDDASGESTFKRESQRARSAAQEMVTMSATDDAPAALPDRVKPGPAWRDLLLGDGLLKTLLQLYMGTRALWLSSGDDCEVPHLLRQLLLLLASVSGSIFDGDGARLAHAERLVSASLLGVLGTPLAPIQVAACVGQTFDYTGGGSVDDAVHAAASKEYLDMCMLVRRLVDNFGPARLAPLRGFEALLQALLQLCQGLLEGAVRSSANQRGAGAGAAHDLDDDIDNSWVMEAFDHLLRAWVAFVRWGEKATASAESAQEAAAGEAVKRAASSLYETYLLRRLQMARAAMEHEEAETFNEGEVAEDPSAQLEHLVSVSWLGRAEVETSLRLVRTQLEAHADRLRQAAGAALTPETVSECGKLSEELYWLVLLASFLLADPAEGERPMIPTCILRLSGQFAAQHGAADMQVAVAQQDPVVSLSWSLLRLAEFESQRVAATHGEDDRISPLLSQKLLLALSRWSESYLVPERGGMYTGRHSRMQDGLPYSIDLCFGANEQGKQVMDFLVKCSSIYLSSWGSEAEVNLEALNLLRAVVKTPEAGRFLLSLSSWETLCQAHVRSAMHRQWAPLDGLSSESHGSLVEVLIRSLAVTGQVDHARIQAAQGHFAQLVQPCSGRLKRTAMALVQETQHVGSKPSQQTSKLLTDPLWTADLRRLRQIYLGVAKAADDGPVAGWCRRALLDSFGASWTEIAGAALMSLQRLGFGSPASAAAVQILSDVLQLVCRYMMDQIFITTSQELPQVWQACSRMVKLYTDFYALVVAKGAGANLDEETWAGDVLHLLEMLTKVAERKSLDFSEDFDDSGAGSTEDENGSGGTGAIVLQGITLVFPLLSKELLQYPGLPEQLFRLLSELLGTFPDQVANLRPDMFAPVVQALEFGMIDHRPSVSREALLSLAKLAEFHALAKAANPPRPGLGANLYPNGAGAPSVLLKLLHGLMSFLIFQTFDASLRRPAASAMLALIVCEQDSFAPMVEQIIQGQDQPALQERLRAAFTQLVSSGGLQLRYDRVNRNKFHDNVLVFVNEVRGFMCQR